MKRAGSISAFYLLAFLMGLAAFLYPFWIPSEALPGAAHGIDAPLMAGLVSGLVITALAVEIRQHTMTGATVAALGVLSASAGLLRLIDLPGGGSGIFFIVVLAGAAFGPRFGFLLGLCSMAVSALLTGGIGPWLPFQMLALSWMGAGAGLLGRVSERLNAVAEVTLLAGYGWIWGFIYGAVMNLWFWPYVRDGGPLSWEPGLGFGATIARYWSFYVITSLAWDAAGATANAILIALTGGACMRVFRRHAHRLAPAVVMLAAEEVDASAIENGCHIGSSPADFSET